ncbi:SAM-dependent methyltransferase [Kineosporia sp. J2-2]|uniref:SAM-dependent methyltransferase n=1 Tax=Kineosporia corallincola TaxID=2835133 RepID=A0ABS5TEJ8_9ACTN|nr:SAM-dependent methyltransferase [Kineosporia corallincola]MBT0769512.1 SAM-dependent methyltransferase [Kineosporia corallincola]
MAEQETTQSVLGDSAAAVHPDHLVPNSARMYDYWLGGKDNYAADRQLADLFLQKIPSMREMARANRDFVNRAARVLAADGVRQFLDIGTGIPTSPNLHETAQAVAPDAHVVYADNDPVVLAHARALMVSNEVGQVAYIAADLRRPERILSDPQLREQLDLDRPVALMLIAVLMLIDDQDDVQGAVAQLREALPSGSYLALTHPTADFDPPVVGEVTASARATGMTFVPRTKAEVAGFFGDWELTEPGIVPVRAWRPDGEVTDPESAWYWAGVARKP